MSEEGRRAQQAGMSQTSFGEGEGSRDKSVTQLRISIVSMAFGCV